MLFDQKVDHEWMDTAICTVQWYEKFHIQDVQSKSRLFQPEVTQLIIIAFMVSYGF